MFTGMITNSKKRTVDIYVKEEHWEAFEKSDELKAMENLILKLKGCKREEQDGPVTRKDLSGYATWNDVINQIRCVDSRIDMRDRILGFVAGIAVLALAVAIHAIVHLR